MDKESVVKAILRIPRDKESRLDTSLFETVLSTGVGGIRHEISVDDLRKEIEQAPQVIKDWIQYSEDQRCTPSFYLLENANGEYVVGYMPRKGEGKCEERCYPDSAQACAQFILDLLDSMLDGR